MQHVDPEKLTRDQLIAHVYNLEARLEEAGAVVKEQPVANLRATFGLTKYEAILLCTLADGKTHNKESLLSALYFERADDAPEIKIVDVFVCKIRKKLVGYPVRIDTVWGTGYRIFDTAPLKAAMAGEQIDTTGGERTPYPSKPLGAKGRPHGSIKDKAIAYLVSIAVDGVASISSRDLTTELGGSSGSVIIQNLERTGHVEIARRAHRHKRGEPWELRLLPKAYGVAA